jgi:hypothetical protein
MRGMRHRGGRNGRVGCQAGERVVPFASGSRYLTQPVLMHHHDSFARPREAASIRLYFARPQNDIHFCGSYFFLHTFRSEYDFP